jgi:hypothetical protein
MPTIEGAAKHLMSLGEPTDIVAMATWKQQGLNTSKAMAESLSAAWTKS